MTGDDALRAREPLRQRRGEASGRVAGQCAGGRQLLDQSTAANDLEPVDRQGPQQRQLAVDEAQGAAYRNVEPEVRDDGRHELDLLDQAVDELGLIAPVDLQRRLSEQRLGDLDFAL